VPFLHRCSNPPLNIPFTVTELQALVIILGFIKIALNTLPCSSSREGEGLKGASQIYIYISINT